MKKSSTAVKILLIALLICAPLFLYDMLQKQVYSNATLSHTGVTIGYNTTTSMITVDYNDINDDLIAADTVIYSVDYTSKHPYSVYWPAFENTSYSFPVEVEFQPPDKDVTYSVKATVVRRIGNYTYVMDITPSSKERSVGGI